VNQDSIGRQEKFLKGPERRKTVGKGKPSSAGTREVALLGLLPEAKIHRKHRKVKLRKGIWEKVHRAQRVAAPFGGWKAFLGQGEGCRRKK